MPNNKTSRRSLLQSGMLFGAASLVSERTARAEPTARVDPLLITNIETFALRHKLPKPIGVSIALSDIRQALLVKITAEGGLVGWGETLDVGGVRATIENKL